MSTTSIVVDAAQTGLAYTADLNNALAAINTCHSGTTAPTDEVVAGKLWLDTSGAHPVLKIYRNGWKSLFTLNTTTVDMNINSITSTGITLTGDASLGDSNKIKLGAGDDLQLYHDGTHSYILDSGTGNLKILGNQIEFNSADNTESMATFVENGAASLFHNNIAKLATSSTGVTVTGELAATTLVGDGSSLTGIVGVETGIISYFAATTAPSGFIKANGATLSRTTYANLFAVIGETFGAGNGSTTFLIPDLRGEFLRGLDDGRGIDASRVFGSAQGDAIRNITGTLTASKPPAASGAFTVVGGQGGGSDGGQNTASLYTFNASNVVPTAAENRPRNLALLACIKFQEKQNECLPNR